MACMNYFGVMFGALTFQRGLNFCGATRWIIPIGLTGFLLVSRTVGLVGIAKRYEQGKARPKIDKPEAAAQAKKEQ